MHHFHRKEKPILIHTKTIWSDQDGVIAVYEPKAYRQHLNPNTTPVFFLPNVHYYATVKPDEKIIAAYQQLNQEIPLQILTNLTDDMILAQEHEADKIQWTKTHMPFLNIAEQYHPIHIPKWKFATRYLKRSLQPTDILISDFNNDLIPWKHAGGTAVKYLNGINSEKSYDGPHILPEWSSEEIKDYILNLP